MFETIIVIAIVGGGAYAVYRILKREKPAKEAENDPGADGAPPDKPFPK